MFFKFPSTGERPNSSQLPCQKPSIISTQRSQMSLTLSQWMTTRDATDKQSPHNSGPHIEAVQRDSSATAASTASAELSERLWRRLPQTSHFRNHHRQLTLEDVLLGLRLTAGAAAVLVTGAWWLFSVVVPTAGDGVDVATAACAGCVTWSAGSDSGTVWSVGRTIGLPDVVDIAGLSILTQWVGSSGR